MKKTYHPDTLAVHAGDYIDPSTRGVNTPIFTSTAFDYVDIDELKYPRAQNTPNHKAVINKLCALEKSEAGLLFGSGMGAVSCALLSLLKPGDHAIIQNDIYGGSHYFVTSELKKFGIAYSLVDGLELEDFASAIQSNSKLIYLETPSNPLLNIVDLKKLGDLARNHKLISVIDNTFASPINLNPKDFGIDVIIHSGSKYLGGHSDIMFGAVLSSQELIDTMFSTSMSLGSTVNAQTCYLIERSLKTLSLRVQKQSQNALFLAQKMEASPLFKAVRYPGLKSSVGYEIAKTQMKGFGAVVTFEPTLNCDDFVRKLKLIKPAMSLGGVESTITSPARSSHMKLTAEERSKLGISDSLLRVSVGIEYEEDLLEDLIQACT